VPPIIEGSESKEEDGEVGGITGGNRGNFNNRCGYY
jgi:hypothetical protein